jgi:hypothetical protein
MTIQGKGGRRRIIKQGQKWVYKTFNFTPKEFARFERLRGRKTRICFLLDMMDSYEGKR